MSLKALEASYFCYLAGLFFFAGLLIALLKRRLQLIVLGVFLSAVGTALFLVSTSVFLHSASHEGPSLAVFAVSLVAISLVSISSLAFDEKLGGGRISDFSLLAFRVRDTEDNREDGS